MRDVRNPYDRAMTQGSRANRWIAWVILLVILGCGGGLGYAKLVRPNIVPKNFGVVDEGKLYRSGELTPAATERVVADHHVRTIIDLGGYDHDPVGERLAERTAEALGVERRVFRLQGDGTGNPNAYVEALRIITDPAKQPVLVHCSAGSQRTGACVLLYREIVQGKPFEGQMGEAYEHGHDPASNPKLRPYLEQWHVKIGEAFRSETLIDGEPKAEIVSPAKGG
jgi:protein tyrosine phosphatase (PTP) superfamily phosphohydrolase (DUF442 family)